MKIVVVFNEYFFCDLAPKYLFWFRKDGWMLADFGVKIPAFMPWPCFLWAGWAGRFWRQSRRLDKPLA